MEGQDGGLAGLGLREGDVELGGEGLHGLAGLGIAHAAARDQQGGFGIRDDIRDIGDLVRVGGDAGDLLDALGKESVREVVALAFHVLAQGDAHRAAVGGIGEGAHGVDQGAHDLLGTGDAVPVAAHGLIGVVGGDGQGIGLLELLQDGIRLAGAEGVRREQQQRDIVYGGRGGGGDHVGRAGADGRGAGDDLAAVVLLGEGRGGVGHPLLVLPLKYLQRAGVFIQRLTQSADDTVTEDGKDTFHELGFLPVEGDVLVVKEFDDCLTGGHDGHMNSSLY